MWKWLGFTQKVSSIRLLEKCFVIDVDYKKSVVELAGTLLEEGKIPIKQNGGQNKQIFMLNIKCFKSLCLKAQTTKADEIHEYYMKMEEVLCKTLEEETDELRLQLEQKDNAILEKDNAILEIKESNDKEKQKLKKD